MDIFSGLLVRRLVVFLVGVLDRAKCVSLFSNFGMATNKPVSADDLVINQLFGTVSGLGMGFITFDWSQISFIGSPLMVPWWAQVHVFAGFVLVYWIILPILYYTNVRIFPTFTRLPVF